MKTAYWRPFTILFLFLLTSPLSFSALVDINLSAPVIIGDGTLQIQYFVYRELGYTYEITNLTILLRPISGSSTPYTIASTAPLYSLSNTNMTNTVSYPLPPESFGKSYNIEFIELYRTVATGAMSTAIEDVRLDIPSKTVPETKTVIVPGGETIVVSTLRAASTAVVTTVANGQTLVFTSTVPASVMTVTLGPTVSKSAGQPGPTNSNSGGCRVREGKILIWTMMSVWLGYWRFAGLYG